MLFSSLFSYYYFTKYPYLIVWACVFGVFLPFFSYGSRYRDNAIHILGYTLLTLLVLTLMLMISLLNEPYYSICRALVFFGCLCSHRYLTGDKILSVFLMVYVILFSYLYQHIHINSIFLIFSQYAGGILIACVAVLIATLIFPKIVTPIPPPDKDIYVVKQAIRLTLIITAIFVVSHFTAIKNTAWICFSALVISEGDFWRSSKKALERAVGTIIGAVLGGLIAHYLFTAYPYMLYLSFVFIFFTYYYIRQNYAVGIALATIWITASFYLIKPAVNIDQFILARVIDTLVGICFGLFGEIFIFPKEPITILFKKIKNKLY